ncbi:putative two-component system sensor kinase [Candidatus Rhodobacter oscarellae]|uniref:histidine kinase n=1 Tax=Candidatus Rhodobacter oscarellae TaxID=1675527 RepID=A0A0J9GU91_9RHOB|nr:sensor histidine kinase [Candidatus Rhodobacter lobularis]KMW57123.1 putative two-component system sensor kinase [Candidatus Rhodobacter lobularis]
MPQLFWNPLSVNCLAIGLLSIVLSAFVFRRLYLGSEKQKAVRFVVLLWLCSTFILVLAICQFFSVTAKPDVGNYFLLFSSPVGFLSVASFVAFAFLWGRESSGFDWMFSVLILIFLGLFGFESWISVQRYKELQRGVVEFREVWADIPFSALLLLACIFLTTNLTRVISVQSNLRIGVASLRALKVLATPWRVIPVEQASVRAFFYVSVWPFGTGIAAVLRSYGYLSWAEVDTLSVWFLTFALAGLLVAYLNYVSETSSFSTKLIGMTFVVVLVVLSGISWLVGGIYVQTYSNPNDPTSQTSLHFERQENGAYRMRHAFPEFDANIGTRIRNHDRAVELPFSFPFFQDRFEKFYWHPSGMIGFHSIPRWRDVQFQYGPQPAIFVLAAELEATSHSGIYMRSTEDRVILTWHQFSPAMDLKQDVTFQVTLFRKGDIVFSYDIIPSAIAHDLYEANLGSMMRGIVPGFGEREVVEVDIGSNLPVLAAPGQGIIAPHRYEFLAYLNRVFAPVALYLIASTLLVFALFPRLLRTSITLPLGQLLRGVQSIMAGNLSTKISIVNRDEIGFLSDAFNEMAQSQRDLIRSLERKVAERTAEVAEYASENARLQERNRLSNELHDLVSQNLFSANLIADALPDLILQNSDQVGDALKDIQLFNKNALNEMREVLVDLRTERPEKKSFGSLLRLIIQDVTKQFSTEVNLMIESDTELPDEIDLVFSRIARESLVNASKHSNASAIQVYFDGVGSQALLRVKDNGKGFSPLGVAPRHMGLQIMNERIAAVGGSLDIKSTPTLGTVITAIWIADEN